VAVRRPGYDRRVSRVDEIEVRPVLFCAPVFWVSNYWADSAHTLDWVRAETPLLEKPSTRMVVSVDTTLGDVFLRACNVWGLRIGEARESQKAGWAANFVRFAFVRPEDSSRGLTASDGHRWPPTLPIARPNGAVEQVPGLEATIRELLASSALGLIEGDVTRPYVHPVSPQGDPHTLIVVGKLTAHAIHNTYAALDAKFGPSVHAGEHVVRTADAASEKVIDDGLRIAAVVAFARWIRGLLKREKPGH
jgi:hypothetical protein